ncbi:MAG TPA: oligopeptide/dipeptide ABC transporter ATP-binding protein [Nocardioidaceae bacterium]|nr:oligopeptide/dipeptide ABC transporter ATP-binding protein [Nocardioidaceae bacterium]
MTAIDVERLSVHFHARAGSVMAVDEVTMNVPPGAVVGLVGESGSGKSTLARAIVGLVSPTSGSIRIDGADLATLSAGATRRARLPVQMIFQDPNSSLNPRMTVGAALSEALGARERVGRATRDEVADLLDLVTLDRRVASAYPRELSGGQRQRVAIARALAVKPDVLICDEVTSALDASVTGAIRNLLRDLRRELGLSILFISHNLAVVRYVSDQIGVMYLGRVVEFADAEALVRSPEHPYTRALLDAVPRLGGVDVEEPATLERDVDDLQPPEQGCAYLPRCPVGPLVDQSRTVCAAEDPQDEATSRRHEAACHFARAES